MSPRNVSCLDSQPSGTVDPELVMWKKETKEVRQPSDPSIVEQFIGEDGGCDIFIAHVSFSGWFAGSVSGSLGFVGWVSCLLL